MANILWLLLEIQYYGSYRFTMDNSGSIIISSKHVFLFCHHLLTADTPTIADSQQAPSTSLETTTEPSATDEQPSSEPQSPEGTSEQGMDNNSNPGDQAASEGEQEATDEGSFTGE